MALWNHDPFYDSDDDEGVYQDDGLIKAIKLLYCSNCNKELLMEMLISSEESSLNRLLYRCPVCTKRYWMKKNEVIKKEHSVNNSQQGEFVFAEGSNAARPVSKRSNKILQ